MAVKRVLKHLLWVIPTLLVAAIAFLANSAARQRNIDEEYHGPLNKTLRVTSKNFANDQPMPAVFSCRGEGRSPHIAWTDAPAKTKSYALVAMDWDVPSPGLPTGLFGG